MAVKPVIEYDESSGVYRINVVDDHGNVCVSRVDSIVFDGGGVMLTLRVVCGGVVERLVLRF